MCSHPEDSSLNEHCVMEDMSCEAENEEFPKSIKEFGYCFNEYGQLRHCITGEPFKFEARKQDHDYNQRRYEILGELVTEYVYDLLVSDTGLKKVYIPVDANKDEPRTFIFMSDDALTNPDKLLILIHGSGVVRAGQWARRLVINECLNSGTQLPFIKRAQGLGYGVIVLNTNDNDREINGIKVPIRGNKNADAHALYVWKKFIQKANAKHIAIVSHSYGGVVTMNMANVLGDQFKNRVFGIALTDSVHSLHHQKINKQLAEWLQKVSKNWVSSQQVLDTSIKSDPSEIPCVSAGHTQHEMTSWSSFASIFEFLDQKYRDAIHTPLHF